MTSAKDLDEMFFIQFEYMLLLFKIDWRPFFASSDCITERLSLLELTAPWRSLIPATIKQCLIIFYASFPAIIFHHNCYYLSVLFST